jgi:exosortase
LVSSLFASAIDWTHTLVLFLLGGSMTGGLVAAWLFAASRPIRFVPFNYVAGVGIFLWLLSLPLPPGTYSNLTLTMQLWVSDRVLETLHLLGIPAIQSGNIIELARTSVGVEDACSGVRSLLSCIYAGFFFSAAFVQHWLSRGLLILLAPLLAVGMNFLRSLTLTLLANKGVDIEGTWHDVTGFAILGITAVILGALAFGLENIEGTQSERESKSNTDADEELPSAITARPGAQILTVGYTAAVACIATFVFLTRPAIESDTPVPQILSFLPAEPDGWKTATSTGLYRFADILETDHLGQRTYIKELPDGEMLQVTFYLAYWPPGQAGVSVVATHTPDACWPGAGWTALPTTESSAFLELPQRTLQRAEYRLFTNERIPQNVWFWHSYDRQVIPEFNPRRPLQLLKSIFAYGVRSKGEQLFVRMSSNHPWEVIQEEPLIEDIFNRLEPYGL